RFGEIGKEKPGIVLDGKHYDISEHVHDFDESFFETGGIEKLVTLLQEKENFFPEIESTIRLGSPIARPSKIVCIGLNYASHAKETNATPPTEPVIFMKSTTSLCGPFDDVMIPRDSVKTDWEVE